MTTITVTDFGAQVSFGVEKSIKWDWFLVRVGGSRSLFKRDIAGAGVSDFNTAYFFENSDVDGTPQDMIGFGIGLNFEGRLRFDITLNEALPFFNPFGGGLKQSANGAHPFLQISSTFSL